MPVYDSSSAPRAAASSAWAHHSPYNRHVGMTAIPSRGPIFRMLKRAAKRWLFRLDALCDRLREPSITGGERVQGLDKLANLYPSTIIVVRPDKFGAGHVKLEKGTYLGRRVELEAGEIEIGEGVTIQDGGAVRGRVRIGAHCMIGHNSLIVSNNHNFQIQPEWLITDQDEEFHRSVDETHIPQRVRIDDDCWLGWCCCVMPGVHIGRGAILSANCLVTNDVGPYEIHGGAPNRKIGERLVFSPPTAVCALNDADLPYFYAGFCHQRALLAESRRTNTILGKSEAAIVLSASGQREIVLEGVCHDNNGGMRLRLWWNGVEIGVRDVPPGPFSFRFQSPDADAPVTGVVPPGLAAYNYLEWKVETSHLGRRLDDDDGLKYGITRAEIY